MTPTILGVRSRAFGFFTRRISILRPAPFPARWFKVAMAIGWAGSGAFALGLVMAWLA